MSRIWPDAALAIALVMLLPLALPAGVGTTSDSAVSAYLPAVSDGLAPMPSLTTLPTSIPSVGPDNNPLSVQAPVLNRTVLDAGQLLNFSVKISGGYKPYNITWLGLPGGGCSSHNQTSFHCKVGVPTGAPTLFEVSVQVVDSMGTTVTSNSTAVTVNPWPTVAVDISPASGGTPPFTVTLTAVPTYGTAPFRYFWDFGDGTNATGATVSHTFTSLGNFEVIVWGNDSLGANSSGSAKIHSVTMPSVSLAATPQATVAQGASIGLSAAPSGGLGPFSYTWVGLPSFCPLITGENTSTVSCSGAEPGTYTITVELTDSLLQAANSTLTLTVTAPTSVWEYVTIGAVILAAGLAIIVVVQLVRYRRQRQPPPALRPADAAPPH